MKHGTRSKYINESCRCPRCVKANKVYLQEYRAWKAEQKAIEAMRAKRNGSKRGR